MDCPRCRKPLVDDQISDSGFSAPVARCTSCGGLLVDSADLDRATRTTEVVGIEWRRLPADPVQLAPCCCPSCGPDEQAMSKLSHPRDREVTVDFCTGCGAIWLDAGELEAIRLEGFFTALRTAARTLTGR